MGDMADALEEQEILAHSRCKEKDCLDSWIEGQCKLCHKWFCTRHINHHSCIKKKGNNG